MADEKKPDKRMVPKRPPGTLCSVEYYKSGRVRLNKDEQNAIKAIVGKISQRDMAARREQVILTWKKHLYDRGLQHLLPQRTGGWMLPALGSGYNPQDEYSRSMFTANIYNPFGQMIVSVLTRQIPPMKSEPEDPDNDVDRTTAEGAERLESRIDRDNNLKDKMEKMGRFLYLDGLAVFLSTYQLDGQRFGYEQPEEELEDETVPEDEEEISEQERASGEGMPESDMDGEASGNSDGSGEAESDSGANAPDDELGSDEMPAPLGEPKGHEVIEVGGTLEWKLPIKAECLADCTYAKRDKEIPVQLAKARYPWIADQLTPSQGGPGGDDIDRSARVNVRLGVLDNFNTTDTQIQDITESKCFLRPCELIDLPDDDMREKLMNLFPRGMYVTFCGQVFAEAYNASMDDHITPIWALPGDGVHRPGLGDWLVPIQEVLNNWLELANDYLIRGVPHTWLDSEMFNVQALKDQDNTPGDFHPFTREPGVQMAEVIWQESPLQFPEALKSYTDDFRGNLAQILTGAVPALTGEGDSNATDTFGGMLVQRDQALGRMGLPWRQIKEGLVNVKRQAIQMLARNHDGAVTIVGSEAVTVELEHMRGNFRVFTDDDENIPASFTQKANALAKAFDSAVTNPQLGELLFNPDNLEIFRDYGMPDLQFPQLEARDKQLGELVILLKGEPLPNPAIAQGQEQIAQLTLQMQQTPDPQQVLPIQQQISTLTQQIAQLPPTVSSVPVRKFDDDATELYVCTKLLNSPRGRELANGDEQDQAAYANVELHATEHETAMQGKAAQQAKATKPPSTSINIKDLPGPEAAALAKQANLPGNAKDFEDQDAAEAVAKHPGQITIQ